MKKKIIGIILAIIIVIAVIAGIIFTRTDMFKSPEQLFYQHFLDGSNLFGKMSYSDMLEDLKKEMETPREEVGEITAKVKSNNEESQAIGTLIEKGKITYNLKSALKDKKMQGNVILNYDGNDVINLNVIKNDEVYGVKMADIYSKYISVENNNLKAIFDKLGMSSENIPDKIEVVDYYELLKIDNDTLKHIEKTYKDIVKEKIPEKCYSLEKNVSIEIDGTSVKTNAYKLELTEKELSDVSKKLLETLKNDDKTLGLIVDKYNMMTAPSKSMGIPMTSEDVTKESLQAKIEEMLEQLNSSNPTDKKAFEVIAYGEKDGRAKVVVTGINEENEEVKSEIDYVKENEDKKMLVTFKVDESQMDMNIVANKTKVSAAIKMISDGTEAEVNINSEIRATGNVQMDELTADNSVKLNDMTKEEIQKLIQDIYSNLTVVLPQKMQLLGINANALNSL